MSGGEVTDDALVDTMKLARDLARANIPIGDMHALMNMTVSEINTIKSLMINESQYAQIRATEDAFLDKPTLTEAEASTVQREGLKTTVERQRREDEFLYQR